MRLGCSGCLGGIVLGVVGALALATATMGVVRMGALPDEGRPTPTAADASRAQQKLFSLVRHSRRAQTVTLSETEVNALLASQMTPPEGTRLSRLDVRLLGDDRAELVARIPLGAALEEIGLGGIVRMLPAGVRERPVRLRAAVLLLVDAVPRQVRLNVDEFAIGQQRLPAAALRLLVDPSTLHALRWRLPEHVDGVAIEPGRVLIQTAP
jgi:hypothetical protein